MIRTPLAVVLPDLIELMRQGKHHMVMVARQQPRLGLVQPALGVGVLQRGQLRCRQECAACST